ncbi:YlqD family protein [Metabacillus arenae]|uniref:YlqD family protein n=1 Tax=Metabacillus arenae TaxID=2771434 RepID=A0A926NL44_9BACI|nr:YlqD family protein [Metabacillus arenae]MBD1380022.1 YlqD family protein [Metabacillus arenae]
MKIIQSIVVKQILTEHSKQELQENFMRKKQQLERECNQLYFQLKKIEKTKNNQTLRLQYKKEIEKRKEKIEMVDFQLEQVHTLPLGSELKEKEVQALIDIQVGDKWSEVCDEKTILLKDGIIEEIRLR